MIGWADAMVIVRGVSAWAVAVPAGSAFIPRESCLAGVRTKPHGLTGGTP